MELKEYTKQLEKEKDILQGEILDKIKAFEELTGLSIDEITTTKIYGGGNQKSRVIQVKIKTEV